MLRRYTQLRAAHLHEVHARLEGRSVRSVGDVVSPDHAGPRPTL
jgi:hypothetical protein